MAVTTDEILAMGKGPVQMTWADQQTPTTAPVATPPTTSGPTTTAEPGNPRNAAEVVQRGVVNVANPQTDTDAEHITPVSEQQTTPEKKKLSYVEMFQQMSPYKPPTPEELEKERKKQKREAIFAAIGEGISAMSNLYFTTQYAPNAFDPSKGMAATTKARFDRLKKDREDNQRQYMDGFMRAMQMDDTAGYKETLAQMREREQKRKESETNISIALKQADLDYKLVKIDGQTYINELYRLKGQALEAGMGAQVELIQEKIETEKAKQLRYRQGGSGGRGGKKTTEYPWYDSDGNLYYAPSYEAMRQNAINHGTWSESTQESITVREQKDRHGKTKGQTVTKTTKPAKGHSTKPNDKWANASKIKY